MYYDAFPGFGLKQTVAPATEPLSVGEAKLHARVDIDDDDDLIRDLIAAAREYAENATGRQLLTATWVLSLDQFPGGDPWWGPFWRWGAAGTIRLPRPPLQSVTSIQYTNSLGQVTTVASTDYIVDNQREPPRITPQYGKVWPVTLPVPNNVQITYVSGYTDPTLIPRQVKLGMKLLVSEWYDDRGSMGKPLEAADRLFWQAWTGEV